jgi:hypothetical protein
MEKHSTEILNEKVIQECHQMLNEIDCCPTNYKLVRSLRAMIRRVVELQSQGPTKKITFRSETRR